MVENGTCAVHGIKCEEWTKTEAKVDDLQKSKLSIAMTRIIISVIALCGVVFFYRVESQQVEQAAAHSKEMKTVMSHVTRVADQVDEHILVSNVILRNMSREAREVRMNLSPVMDKLEMDFIEIPPYYGTD